MDYRPASRTLGIQMPTVTVYVSSDGLSDGDWARRYGVLVRALDVPDIEVSVEVSKTTNLRAQLLGLLDALEEVSTHDRSNVFIHHKCEMIDTWAAHGGIQPFAQRNFIGKDGKPILNADLWEQFVELDRRHNFLYRYLPDDSKKKAHERNFTQNKYLKYVDRLCGRME